MLWLGLELRNPTEPAPSGCPMRRIPVSNELAGENKTQKALEVGGNESPSCYLCPLHARHGSRNTCTLYLTSTDF